MTIHPRTLILAAIAVVVAAGAAMLVSQTSAQVPGTVTYRYDSLGRVVQDIYPAQSGAYSYDAAGNRVSATLN
jgi:uncharacterized protein RhaS with RHS repeats